MEARGIRERRMRQPNRDPSRRGSAAGPSHPRRTPVADARSKEPVPARRPHQELQRLSRFGDKCRSRFRDQWRHPGVEVVDGQGGT